jgi:putative transposase
MSFWRTYYHLVWATKDRAALITPDREIMLYPYLVGKCDHLGGTAHQIGGIANHVHLIVSIPPKIAIADFVQHLKGSSTYHLNHQNNDSRFAWQLSYGVFSLSKKRLEDAIDYVAHQKQHHGENTTIPALERDS